MYIDIIVRHKTNIEARRQASKDGAQTQNDHKIIKQSNKV